MDPSDVYASLFPGAVTLISSSPGTTGILLPLPTPRVEAILAFGVFEIVTGSRFDSARSLIAMCRSREDQWDSMSKEFEIFLLYTFETAQVFLVPSPQKGTRS